MPALFELDEISKLPLFAQAFIASRMARRAALHLPGDFPAADRKTMLDICDVLDRAVASGASSLDKLRPHFDKIYELRGGPAGEAAEAVYWALDAASAADAANDFPVDTTCIRDTQNALAAASRSHGLSPLQVRVFAAADLDTLRFVCAETKIGFYDPLGSYVMERVAPVYPPDMR